MAPLRWTAAGRRLLTLQLVLVASASCAASPGRATMPSHESASRPVVLPPPSPVQEHEGFLSEMAERHVPELKDLHGVELSGWQGVFNTPDLP